MRQKLSKIQVIFIVMITIAASNVDAQNIAPGPYYATPSWDQKFSCETQANCPRFVVLSDWINEAVLDMETGLVWQRRPGTTRLDGYDAASNCHTATTGLRMGWRLPMIQELTSLLRARLAVGPQGDPRPNLPLGHPFQIVKTPDIYWSGTSFPGESSLAWSMTIGSVSGNFANIDNRQMTHSVWCVRGPQ